MVLLDPSLKLLVTFVIVKRNLPQPVLMRFMRESCNRENDILVVNNVLIEAFLVMRVSIIVFARYGLGKRLMEVITFTPRNIGRFDERVLLN